MLRGIAPPAAVLAAAVGPQARVEAERHGQAAQGEGAAVLGVTGAPDVAHVGGVVQGQGRPLGLDAGHEPRLAQVHLQPHRAWALLHLKKA